MKYSIVYLLFLVLIIGCRTQKEIGREPERVIPTRENVNFLGEKALTGYLYEYYQEKCPGTFSNGNTKRCVRIITIFSKNRIETPASLINRDTVSVDSSLIIVLDSQKFNYVLPIDVFGEKKIREMFPNETSYQESKYYESHFVTKLKENRGSCTLENHKNVRITECIVSEEVSALVFSATNDLLKYTLSPSIGLPNFGMPLHFSGVVSRVVWLVPIDSPIFSSLPPSSPSM